MLLFVVDCISYVEFYESLITFICLPCNFWFFFGGGNVAYVSFEMGADHLLHVLNAVST